jgi:hypothetical protein
MPEPKNPSDLLYEVQAKICLIRQLFQRQGDITEFDCRTCQGADSEAMYACAGYAAVLVAGYSEEEVSAGCGPDFDGAEKVIDMPLETVQKEAIELMSRPENVKAVKRIVDELLVRKTLGPEEVEILIDVADGEITEEEYRRVLRFLR